MASYQKAGGNAQVNGGDEINDAPRRTKAWKWGMGAVAAAVIIGIIVSSTGGRSVSKDINESTGDDLVKVVADNNKGKNNGKEMRLFDERERYVLEDYDARPTFASFLPGIAGLYGKPSWMFYVNRGQGVATFGTLSKEYPILEFNAANKAYQLTPYVGFRTFIQGRRGGEVFLSEPFSPDLSRVPDGPEKEEALKPKRVMYVGPNEMEVKEVDTVNNLMTNVTYIVLPNEDFPSLVRRTTFTNVDADTNVTMAILDGLAKMEPAGGKLDWGLKNMGRTLEGWMGVYHADKTLAMPFFRMSTEPSDDASVKIEKEGHYCLSFIETNDDNPHKLLPIVYDPDAIFGPQTSLTKPDGLLKNTVKQIVEGKQYGDAKTSSAFAAVEEVTLAPGESVTMSTFYGKVKHIKKVSKVADVITAKGYVTKKFDEARKLVDDLTASVNTNSADHLFNGAVRQMFLDNALRGGLPVMLGSVDDDAKMSNIDEDPRVKVFHAFSRIHGDLERDYNTFSINPTFFSQGPGNYRDVAQNRRSDVIFQPRMASFDVKMFLSFIQADAYEPLTVEAISFSVQDKNVARRIAKATSWSDPNSTQILTDILVGGAFRPGQLFDLVEQLKIRLDVTKEHFLDTVLSQSNSTPMAVFGSGYWGDHWDYYLDLIDAYLSIYPDGEEALMYDHQLKYFFSTASVKPRSEKYVVTLTFDASGDHILQLDATDFDEAKEAEQAAFIDPKTGLKSIDANWQRTHAGVAFTSAPIAKLFLLGAIKFATRDAYGMGVEYEAGKPGWNDAMNGLVGMVGSGMPETYELKLLLEYVSSVLKKYKRPIVIPVELGEMIENITKALDTLEASGYADPETLPEDVPKELFTYWDTVATARENYRAEVNYYFSGNTTEIPAKKAEKMLQRWIAQVDLGIERAMKFGSKGFEDDGTSGVPPCYFAYDVTDWTLNGKSNDVGLPLADPKAMKVVRFPLFLEGPVRMMKTIDDDEDAMKDMYGKVLNSGLRDKGLKMYTVSANLEGQSYDMGRMMAFAPGWLENQSIWLHMSYKYYLQLLRGKLYKQFYSEMKNGGILPYMDPHVYGRSLMECSSFLASSAFKDPAKVGRGFVARLSGSTAEFLSMWVLMFIGPKPFALDDNGELQMQLVPALPVWLFKTDDDNAAVGNESSVAVADDDEEEYKLSFKLFSSIVVTYHNTKKTDLFGIPPKKYQICFAGGAVQFVNGPTIPSELADRIRRVEGIGAINCWF